MLTYTDTDIRDAIKNIDTSLRELERRADAIGYKIEKNALYLDICETLTAIEWGDVSPSLSLWVALGKYIQGVAQEIQRRSQ